MVMKRIQLTLESVFVPSHTILVLCRIFQLVTIIDLCQCRLRLTHQFFFQLIKVVWVARWRIKVSGGASVDTNLKMFCSWFSSKKNRGSSSFWFLPMVRPYIRLYSKSSLSFHNHVHQRRFVSSYPTHHYRAHNCSHHHLQGRIQC